LFYAFNHSKQTDVSVKVGLLFPGQGAQAVGMGTELVRRSSIAQQLFQQAAEVLGYDLLKLCSEGPTEQLNRTEFCQPALFVHSLAALRQLEAERGDLWDNVAAVAGLSLGEITAVAAAGGVDFEAGLRLVQLRGTAMQSAADAVASGMSSILGLELDKLNEICQQATHGEHFVRVANLLCPGNIAISGHIAALERAEQQCLAAGAMKAVRLAVAGAFHTPIMQPAVEQLSAALALVNFQPTRVPVISNVDAAPHSHPDEFRRLLSQQVVSPVLWEASLTRMLADDCQQFIEVGAGRVLAGTLKRVQRKIPCENVGD
jgi:[acyl-carrier-protein] S-malonyltransferase